MKSNSHSHDSSSQSNKSYTDYAGKKRVLKRMRKDQDGSRFENMDSFPQSSGYKDYEGTAELKTPVRSGRTQNSHKSAYPAVSKFNNGISEEKASNNSLRRKFRREIQSEEEEDHHSNSSSKLKHNRVKVKKIDDEEVS